MQVVPSLVQLGVLAWVEATQIMNHELNQAFLVWAHPLMVNYYVMILCSSANQHTFLIVSSPGINIFIFVLSHLTNHVCIFP